MMNKDLNPEETAAEELSKIFDFKGGGALIIILSSANLRKDAGDDSQ